MLQDYISIVNGIKLVTIMVLIFADTLLGIIVAIKNGQFKLSKISNYLNTSVLSLVGGYYLVGLAVLAEPSFEPMLIASWTAINAALVAAIIKKVKDLGLPVPDRGL